MFDTQFLWAILKLKANYSIIMFNEQYYIMHTVMVKTKMHWYCYTSRQILLEDAHFSTEYRFSGWIKYGKFHTYRFISIHKPVDKIKSKTTILFKQKRIVNGNLFDQKYFRSRRALRRARSEKSKRMKEMQNDAKAK